MTNGNHAPSTIAKVAFAVLGVAVPVCGLLFWHIMDSAAEDRAYNRKLIENTGMELKLTLRELQELRVDVAKNYITHEVLDKRLDKIEGTLDSINAKIDRIPNPIAGD